MSKWSSRCCSASFVLVLIVSVGLAQDKNGEFKHELPEGVELVDPKSLGLTDADLSKFLGNVKVLGQGQVGDTKTQILTVGFEGDENINFNDFDIPGLTDGNKTNFPEKDKAIADMAFKQFKEFFNDPNKAKQFEHGAGGNNNINGGSQKQEHNKHRQEARQQKNHPPNQQQFHIPMIQKPYTTPRTPHLPVTTHHPSLYVQPPPPPPLPPQHRQVVSPVAPIQNNSPPHVFNSQIKNQSPPLEFGARIPLSPRVPRIQPQSNPPQNFQNQQQFHHQQQHHRLAPQHIHQHQQNPPPPHVNLQQQHPPQHIHHQQQQNPPPHIQQQPNFQRPSQPPQQHFPSHQRQPQFQQPQIHFIQHPIPTPQNHQANIPQPFPPRNHPPQTPHPTRPVQTFNQPQQHIHTPPQAHHQQNSQEQGRIVRNQLLQVDQNINGNSNNHLQLRPPPPPPQNAHPSASNQVPIQTQFQSQAGSEAAPATSHVFIQRGPKKTPSVQHTSFHPQFQAPTRFAKDFTPLAFQTTTTSRPGSFDVTPSMSLIPLSTNENAITDPTRMLQLRLYQQQKAQASNTQKTVLPQQQVNTPAPTVPTTTPISITTSYPETDNHQQYFTSSANYQQSSSLGQIGNQINDNDVFNKGSFSLQTQQQQHQLHILQQQQQQPSSQTQSAHAQHHQQYAQSHHQIQPTVFYTQEHVRPPRQGSPNHRPRFQFHMTHELGQPPKVHMYPDPKGLFNTIRRKRGYRRLSNLFNRMFRWDRH